MESSLIKHCIISQILEQYKNHLSTKLDVGREINFETMSWSVKNCLHLIQNVYFWKASFQDIDYEEPWLTFLTQLKPKYHSIYQFLNNLAYSKEQLIYKYLFDIGV